MNFNHSEKYFTKLMYSHIFKYNASSYYAISFILKFTSKIDRSSELYEIKIHPINYEKKIK